MQTSRLFAALALIAAAAGPAQAGPLWERAAFQLAGTCSAHQRDALALLTHTDGVRSIDVALIPHHVVIDFDAHRLSVHELTLTVQRVIADGGCRAEPMASCISAAPLAHRTPSADHVPDRPQ